MSTLNYPGPDEYKLPKKNILVISCMDLRLTDNLVDFLHFDNLHNRYDHFILAGTSLLTTQEKRDLFAADGNGHNYHDKYACHWGKAMMDHIQLAIDLHGIKDIYLVEHQDCGAYTNMLDSAKVNLSNKLREIKWHKKFALELAGRIAQEFGGFKLNVHGFFIDLRGNVELMFSKPG